MWESTVSKALGDAGVVCFISTAGYVGGPGFTAMRRYLREKASEGWVIDLTPEGQTPPVPTRVFPGVRQPLAIGLFVRKAGASSSVPASVHYRTVSGTQGEKFAALNDVKLKGPGWQDTRTEWTAPFTPAPTSAWDNHPAVSDLFPWTSPGVKANRRWVYAPSSAILTSRWAALSAEGDEQKRDALLKTTRDRNFDTVVAPLPGFETDASLLSLRKAGKHPPQPVRVAYRAFDRQWMLPDNRLLDMARLDLWRAVAPQQVFAVEQHAHAIDSGPAIMFTGILPDNDHFNNRGGRVLPLLHPDGTPNTAPGLLGALTQRLGVEVAAEDLPAYVAGIVAHSEFTKTFAEELTTPGVRVPLTANPVLWEEAAELGRRVIWLHTYGAAYSGEGGRPPGDVRPPMGDPTRPLVKSPITELPSSLTYHEATQTLHVGSGTVSPLPEAVWEYEVGGNNVLGSWFNYRKARPGGRNTSPLDRIHTDSWDPDWTAELLELVAVLTQLVDLEAKQADVLGRVLGGPLLDRGALVADGVKWPSSPADRRPRQSLSTSDPNAFELSTDDEPAS